MKLTPFQCTEIYPNLFIYRGAVNTAVLRQGERAILIDCDDTFTPARLAELGINIVERIYCTQHRRPNTAGIPAFQAEVFAPEVERLQFAEAEAYWQDWRNRWHLYHFRPGPLTPLHDIPLNGTVREGDLIQWGGFTLRILDTPGMTDGAVSYVVELHLHPSETRVVIFSGDVLYGHGQVWDIHSLQKQITGTWSDYHGFLGAAGTLIASLEKLAAIGADYLVPSHGEILSEHTQAARLTIQRLEQLNRNYTAVSSLNYYFPHIFEELRGDPWRIAPAETVGFPGFIRFVAATSFAIRSESGALFLIECGHDDVLVTLDAWKEQGLFSEVEGCWVTHYHDDHVDSLHKLASIRQTPIYADEHLVEILAHPSRFFLPCLSPTVTQVTHSTCDRETWRWREFEFTALHFPGQTLYHGGLVVRGHGMTVLFCGDSFAPTGLDDYTAGNRNFLGAEVGFRRCINLVRQHKPDLILNQHQQQAFCFSSDQLDYMEKILVDREALLRELLPWEHPNFGTDEGWIRAYPYAVEAGAGSSFSVEARATNHADRPIEFTADAVLPPGWTALSEPATFSGKREVEWIEHARITITVPSGTQAGTYPVAFRVTWGGRYLGQVCHCLVKVWESGLREDNVE
jgi:glyoxylase-like metal-dependent hydrolase (beta-lactamase superfamily II)